jgi:PAS domain S-box-containing protein
VKSIKILLLEQQEADAERIGQELAGSGLPVEFKHAESRPDFFKVFQEFRPDIVLSDYIAGKTSGLELMRAIRKVYPNQPFIFVSWHIHEASVIEALKAGATDYVFKEQLSRLTLSIYRALREIDERREREHAQTELKKSEEYFRSLIENASDIIMALDETTKVQFASPSMKKVLGYDPAEFIGSHLLEYVHEEDRDNVRFILEQTREKKDFSIEFRFLHASGAWRGLEAIGRGMKEGKDFRIVINARDITDRILEQEALRESIIRHLKTQTELQKAQQKVIQQERMAAIGQMASGIAHDFSNALMPVLGFSEILLSRPESLKDLEKVRKYVEMINTSARDAMHIVGGLREFYRQKEKAENLLPTDIKKTIEQAILLTQPKWKEEARAKGADIKVTAKLDPVPLIVGNESSLREALTNLIFNAVDAMSERRDPIYLRP